MFKVVFLLATFLVAAYAAPAAEDDSQWRVVGGSNAGSTEAPYQVSLRTAANFHFCGGTIINSRTIVTAAHCIVGQTTSGVNVVVGTIYLNSGGTSYPVSRLTTHASYNANTIVNDIAVVITSSAITMSSTVAALPLSTVATGAGVSVKLTGWGSTSYPGSAPNTLQTITLSTITVATCRSSFSGVVDSQVCTYTRVGQGACHGDSGGPLVGAGALVGIVSYGSPCAVGAPDVFTRVSSFITWINSNSQN